jgi:hypothetical protein
MGALLLWGYLDLWHIGRPPLKLQLFFFWSFFVFIYFFLLPAPGLERFLCWVLRKPFLRYSPQTLVLDEEFLELSNASASGKLPWNEFGKFRDTKNLILLRHRKTSKVVLIPKRALSGLELEQLRALLERKILAK